METLYLPNFNKSITLGIVGVLFFIGGLNSLSLYNDSFMDQMAPKFKRLDEISDVYVVGRSVGAVGDWEAIGDGENVTPKQPEVISKKEQINEQETEAKTPPMVDGIVNLKLVEVFNAKKFSGSLAVTDFSGNIEISGSTIDTMSLRLPDMEPIEVYHAPVVNNKVFNYEVDYEKFSGVIFESEDSTFVVSFVNGPMRGTRLKFAKEFPKSEKQAIGDSREDIASGAGSIEQARFNF